jgi:DNA-binding response OmpR family regulator
LFNSADFTVLIVEDDEDLQHIAAQHLTDEGFSVFAVGTGESGWEYIEKEAPDLILLDVMLPGLMDGMSLLRAVRSTPDTATSRLPIIMLTAVAGADRVKEAIALGVTSYLLKPVDLEKLVARIERVLEERMPRHYMQT